MRRSTWASGEADPSAPRIRPTCTSATHQQLQDEFHFSAALWTWRESCGDPHKAGDARAGRIPSVWGEFEVDCRTNTVVGTREALLDQLTRAYVRAAPGDLVASTYDPTTGTFRASGSNAPEGAQLWTWYPAGQAPPDAVTFAGLRDVRVRVAPAGGFHITATTTSASWLLVVSAR